MPPLHLPNAITFRREGRVNRRERAPSPHRLRREDGVKRARRQIGKISDESHPSIRSRAEKRDGLGDDNTADMRRVAYIG